MLHSRPIWFGVGKRRLHPEPYDICSSLLRYATGDPVHSKCPGQIWNSGGSGDRLQRRDGVGRER